MVLYRHIHIFPESLWIKEQGDVWCPNMIEERSFHTQAGCQAICESKRGSECVGIVYSHKLGVVDYCLLCMDDKMEYSINGFGFYRRPGIFDIVFTSSTNIVSIVSKTYTLTSMLKLH